MTITAAAGGVLARLNKPGPAGDVPQWLTEARRAAFAWVAEHGFPTRKDEDWKYTKLAPILDIAFEAALAAPSVTPAAIEAVADDLGGTRLVFVNGFFAAGLSRLDDLPAGATVTNLASELADEHGRIEELFARPTGQRHAFAALNDALTEDGAFIHLAAGVVVDQPIQLVFFADSGGSPLVASPRSIVLAEAGSSATIVETYGGVAGEVYCTNSVTEVLLSESARLRHYKVQDEPLTAFHLALLDVRQQQGSQFRSSVVSLGSAVGRHEVRVALSGDGAKTSLDGLYLPQGEQLHDNTVFVDHIAPNCTSDQLYKGVLDGRGHGVFNGHIMVRPGSGGTDANQKNKNLLLSDRAEVDARPRLEIYTDDVTCTHGAAVGQLDAEALFYLRTRGLSENAARSMLIRAFVHEMVDRIELKPLQARVERLIANRFAAGTGSVEL